MELCPEELLKDYPELRIVWLAATDPEECRRQKKMYKNLKLASILTHLRTYMHPNQPPSIPGSSGIISTLFMINQLSTGVTNLVMFSIEDLYDEIIESLKVVRLHPEADNDLKPPKRRVRLMLPEELFRHIQLEEREDVEVVLGPPLPEELQVEEFFLNGTLPHTVPSADVTMEEFDVPRAATPPCNHDHLLDPHFEEHFGQAIAHQLIPPRPPSPETPPPPPLSPQRPRVLRPRFSPPEISSSEDELWEPQRRRPRPQRRPIQRPAVDLEDLLAALPQIPIEHLVPGRRLMREFLPQEELFPEVDQVVWRDVMGMMMPFFPVGAPGQPLPPLQDEEMPQLEELVVPAAFEVVPPPDAAASKPESPVVEPGQPLPPLEADPMLQLEDLAGPAAFEVVPPPDAAASKPESPVGAPGQPLPPLEADPMLELEDLAEPAAFDVVPPPDAAASKPESPVGAPGQPLPPLEADPMLQLEDLAGPAAFEVVPPPGATASKPESLASEDLEEVTLPPVYISEDDVIRMMVEFGSDEPGTPIGFHELVPTRDFNRYEAARIFEVLLQLHSSRQLKLTQVGPQAEIYIHASALITSRMRLLGSP